MKQPNSTNKHINTEDLQPIIEYIERFYDGDVILLTEWFDRAIYMLHFIPVESEFSQLQKQNVCGALFGMKECLMESYFNNQNLDYEDFT